MSFVQSGEPDLAGRMRMVRVDPSYLAQEAALREWQSWTYLIITGTIILLVASRFIWLTW